MRLTLTDDDGTVLGQWYIPDEEYSAKKMASHIDGELPVYTDREQYEEFKESCKEFEKGLNKREEG